MSPNQEEEEEEALDANKNKTKAEGIPANEPISVPSGFNHSVLCPTTALPAVCDKKTDVTVLSPQQDDDLNAGDDNKTHGDDSPTAVPESSSSVQCMENRQWEEGTGGEDGELLPLDLQLLYMLGKASYVPSPSDEEEEADDADDESCLTEPDELDINVLQHLEKVELSPKPFRQFVGNAYRHASSGAHLVNVLTFLAGIVELGAEPKIVGNRNK
jgi:hypothetical protein